MLKSKLLLFIGLLTLTMFTLSAGTFAFFSNEAISSGNTISAGTLFIGSEDGSRGVLDGFIKLSGMVPGAEAQKLKLKIKNHGTMTAYVNGISAGITESDAKFLANALRTECFDNSGNVLFKGSLLALDGNVVPLERVIALEPGQTTVLKFFVQLDERVGNWYKGKDIEFSFTVYAGQRLDQEVGRRVRLVQGGNVQSALDGAETGDVVLIPAGSYGRLSVKPGITVKAKDVVFDTVVEGITVAASGKTESHVAGVQGGKSDGDATSIQGFTINGRGFGVRVQSGRNCRISDNIFHNTGAPVVVNGSGSAFLTRNDLTGCSTKIDAGQGVKSLAASQNPGGRVQARYNLGGDLNPAEHTL